MGIGGRFVSLCPDGHLFQIAWLQWGPNLEPMGFWSYLWKLATHYDLLGAHLWGSGLNCSAPRTWKKPLFSEHVHVDICDRA